MLKRCLLLLLYITAATTPAQETIKAQETKPQELKGKEASEFLKMASTKIKANCDAIKSWKGMIEAQHGVPLMPNRSNTGAVTIDATFAIATNGDLLVHLDKMSGQTMLPRDASGILGLREPHKPHSIEFFLHGDVVDRATFHVPAESTLPRRITTQFRKEKFKDDLPSAFLDPKSLFIDSGDKRIDEHLEIEAQSALREDSTVVVSKPAGGDGIWTLKVEYKGSDPTAPRLQVIWKLDKAKSFLPTFRSTSMADEKLSERTIEYEKFGKVFLPKLVMEERNELSSQFAVITESLNEGPEKIKIKHRDNDLLIDVDRKQFMFLDGEFRPYDPITRKIKE